MNESTGEEGAGWMAEGQQVGNETKALKQQTRRHYRQTMESESGH